jgi:sec-independent protein translocase protein TatC
MDETKYTLTEHLTELRGRLIKSFLGIVVTTMASLAFAPDLLERAVAPLQVVLHDRNRVDTVLVHPDETRRRELAEWLGNDWNVRLRASLPSLETLRATASRAAAEKRPLDLVLVAAGAIGSDGGHAGDELEGVEPAPYVAYLVTDPKDPIVGELSLEGATVILDPPKKAALARTIRRAGSAAGKAARQEMLVVLSPMDPFFAYIKIALVCGLFLACPIWLFQGWRFVEPGLYPKEKSVVLPAALGGSVLFAAGGSFAYFLVFPVMFDVLINQMMPASVASSFTVDNYLNLLLMLTLAFGLIFELPLVLAIASGVGIVSPETLARYRKYAIIGAFVAGGVLTPTADPLSQLMMAVPLVVFYEVGIIAGRIIARKRQQRIAEAERALEKVG